MFKKSLFSLALVLSGISGYSQTTFLPMGTENYHTLDRLETLRGRLCDSMFIADQPISRRKAIAFISANPTTYFDSVWQFGPNRKDGGIKSNEFGRRTSEIDEYNIANMISESGEWAADENGARRSKHSLLRTFYKTDYNFAYVKTPDFFLVINPVVNLTGLRQTNNPAIDPATDATIPANAYLNSHGAEARGWISKKIGFYTMFTDNQERFPYPVYEYATKKYAAVPGADYFKRPTSPFGTFDYFQAQGYINFDIIKNSLNTTAGFGKHFIGDGITSLFLTDNSSNMPYLQIRARIWKLNYEILYLELTPQHVQMKDQTIGHKYSTMHYLSWDALRWLNLSFFEAQVFSRPDRYEFSYMNPIIFTTAISRYNGAGDKSLLGFSAKAVALNHLQFYGQLVLNEFRVGELTGGRGWYGNKWGVQMGAKYFDAFNITNLDLQGELDAVRPYTYSAQDTIANYTNYNQPLADPLGSGFVKTIGQVKYQPMKNLYLTARATYYVRGTDTLNANYGNDIFKAYPTAKSQYGVNMINGPKATCQMLSLNASYQFRPNMFVDLGGVYRNYKSAAGVYPVYSTDGPTFSDLTTTYIYLGLRINAQFRAYDIF